jgi:hypothetical protein
MDEPPFSISAFWHFYLKAGPRLKVQGARIKKKGARFKAQGSRIKEKG